MSSQFQELVTMLQQWHSRRRLQAVLLWMPRALLTALLLAVFIAGLARYRPLLTNQEVAWLTAVLAIVALTTTPTILLTRRYTLLQQARFADHQFQLAERASTAVEIEQNQLTTTATLAQQQLADTLQIIHRVDTKATMPLHIHQRDWLILLLAIALLITAVLLPNPQAAILQEQRTISQSIEEQVETLEALTEEIQENPDLTDEQEEALLEPVENALQALQSNTPSQEEAVAALSEAETNLRDLGEVNSTQSLQEALQSASQPLSQNNASETLGQTLQNGNLAEAAAATAQLSENLPELSPTEQAALSEALAETAASVEAIDADLAQSLAEAAQNIESGNTQAAQQALQNAATELQQSAQQQAAAQQAQNAATQLNQSRQEVAQAGQPSQNGQAQQNNQAAQQGQGQQGQQGQGQGQQGQQGQGQQGQQGQGTGSQQGSGIGGSNEGGGHTENVFVPEFIDISDEAGVDIELPAECVANPANCGGLLSENATDFTNEGSVVPYEQVFGDYQNAAYEALDDDYIPLGMKGYVRDYFSSLEP